MPLPVKVKQLPREPISQRDGPLRTLWIATNSRGLYAHKPFEDMFYGSMELKAHSIISPTDVVFFDGGTDIDSKIYGEEPHVMNQGPDKERDTWERYCFKRAQAAGAACLGVCRGAQLLVALSGGKLIQHVTGHGGSGHLILTDDGQAIWSESSHHQVMWPNEIPHILIAWANVNAQEPFAVSDEYGKNFTDGMSPEIVYCKDTKSLCIQGHAEYMGPSTFTDFTRKLVREFLIEGR